MTSCSEVCSDATLAPTPESRWIAGPTVRLVGPIQGVSRMRSDTQGGGPARLRSPDLTLGFLVKTPAGRIGRTKAFKIDN